jgi:hypothetical protein
MSLGHPIFTSILTSIFVALMRRAALTARLVRRGRCGNAQQQQRHRYEC